MISDLVHILVNMSGYFINLKLTVANKLNLVMKPVQMKTGLSVGDGFTRYLQRAPTLQGTPKD